MNEHMSSHASAAMSEDIRAISGALLQAKKNFKATGKSGFHANQKWKYALLDEIYDAVEDALHEQSIIIWHGATFLYDSHKELLRTRLIHAPTGQWMEDLRLLESEKPGNQAKGSANTYMRKYAVLSLCAIAAEDDDCQSEEDYLHQQKSQECITAPQLEMIKDLIRAHPHKTTVFKMILTQYKIDDLQKLSSNHFNSAIVSIKNYIHNDTAAV